MGGTRTIVAGRFVDGSGGAVRRNVFLAVKNGIITAIGSVADLPRHDGAVIDDFSHCTILPALVDCSVSLLRSPSIATNMPSSSDQASHAKKAEKLKQHINYCHIHGVQGVADSDDLADLAENYQNSIIDICTGGDFLKLAYSANIEEEENPAPLISYEDLCSNLQHRARKKAVVVANGQQQVDEALEAGCDAIEQGYAMGEDNLRRMAKENVLWIPSVLRAKNSLDGASSGGSVCCRFSTRYVAPGKAAPGAKAFWKKMLAEQITQLRFARELGVTTAIGTGAGSIGILHGESVAEEIKLFIKAGYSLEEAMRCGSENGARFFGMEKLGSLAVGRKATFLITRGMVQQLPRKLSYLEGIYIDGAPSATYLKNPVKTV